MRRVWVTSNYKETGPPSSPTEDSQHEIKSSKTHRRNTLRPRFTDPEAIPIQDAAPQHQHEAPHFTMKTPVIVVLAGVVTSVLGQITALPSSADASAVLSEVFGSSIPSQATGAVATSLASAVYSVELSYYKGPASSDISAIWSAAAKATNSPSVVASMGISGWNWGDIATQDWYTANVPTPVQTDVQKFISAIGSAAESVLSTGTSKGGAAGPKCTGMAMAAAAAGAAGAAVVALL